MLLLFGVIPLIYVLAIEASLTSEELKRAKLSEVYEKYLAKGKRLWADLDSQLRVFKNTQDVPCIEEVYEKVWDIERDRQLQTPPDELIPTLRSLHLPTDGAYLRVWAATPKILIPDPSPRHTFPRDREYHALYHTRAGVIIVEYMYKDIHPLLRGQPVGEEHWSDIACAI